MGVGFVGAVMAGVIADSVDRKTGHPGKFVIGMQRPSSRSFWKIPYLNRGVAPVEAEDPEVAPLIRRCVLEKKTLTATFTYEALKLADVVVVDVQCDYHKQTLGNVRQGHADIAALEDSLKVIGEKIGPECLVLIETTVPPGTTEYVAYPIIKKAFEQRGLSEVEPLLGHSFERVMPGRNYVASIRDFWRVCSGINPESARARDHLSLRDPERRKIPADGPGPSHRERNLQDRGELLPRDDSRLPGRVEPVCRAQRRGPHQGDPRPSRCGRPTPT